MPIIDESIIIDRNNLDEECASAPAFFDYWQTQETDAKTRKENLESQMSMELRGMAEEVLMSRFGVKKLTEGAINSIIGSDENFQQLKSQQLGAEAERKSFEQKIRMLDVLARLHGQGYFSKIESKPNMRTIIANKVKKEIEKQIKSRKTSGKPRRPRT